MAPPPPLQVLLLDDSVDADLILRELRLGGYEPVARRSASRGELLEALSDGSWQIVLRDYSLKGGGTALKVLTSLAELNIDPPATASGGRSGTTRLRSSTAPCGRIGPSAGTRACCNGLGTQTVGFR